MDPQIREIQYGNYRIIYRYDGARILIITVIHGSMHLNLGRFLE
jgi:plasmid stabilization system protein ParE